MSPSQETPHFGRSTFTRSNWAWQETAGCRGEDLALFFGPPTGEDREHPADKLAREAEAKWICGGCKVRTECLDYAIDQGERYGIWGGLDEDERARYRRARTARELKARRRKRTAA